MFKIIIKKDNVITHGAKFETEEKALEWFNQEKEKQAFGKNEWVESIHEIMDDAGNTIEPAKQINHPAEYTYEIIDITQEVEQEKTKKEKKEAKKRRKRVSILILL